MTETRSAVPDEFSESGGRNALRGGVVCDVAAAAQVIAPILHTVGSRWRRPAALVCAPTDATQQERDLLVEAVVEAGATVAAVAPEPLAAAIGAGLDLSCEYAQFVVDIGEGVTDLAVIRGGAITTSTARRTGCSELRRTVTDWFRWHRSIVVAELAADEMIRSFCRAGNVQTRFEIDGRAVGGGQIVGCTVSRDDLGSLIEPALDSIAEFVLNYFLQLPDRLAAEVIESGTVITGGGAVLDRLLQQIESSTGLSVIRAPDPLRSVIIGAREMLRSGVLPAAA